MPHNTMNHRPLVSIVLVNWKGLSDTLDCVRSCLTMQGPPFEIVIVDNDSQDGSAEALTAALGSNPAVTLLLSKQNLGYAGANNLAITRALDSGTDFVWLLNNDTIVNPKTLQSLVDAAAAHPRAGMLGSKILYFDHPNTIWFAGASIQKHGNRYTVHRGFKEIDRGQYDQIEEVEYVTGCSLLVRAATLRDIHLMPDEYFMYWEDVEWCTRARLAGWSCLYVPQSTLLHKVNSSTRGQSGLRMRYETRNRLHYLWRFDKLSTLESMLCLPFSAMRSIAQKDWRSAYFPLLGVFDFLRRRTGRLPS
jgi:GT2 family glycosyltransferase